MGFVLVSAAVCPHEGREFAGAPLRVRSCEFVRFAYDDLYRPYHGDVGSTNLEVRYDVQRNITSKSDVGAGVNWTYNSANKPHAVRTAGTGNSYDYDSSGNMSTRNGWPISWTSANYPQQINSATETLLFTYGPDRQRMRQSYGSAAGTEVTYFIGDAMEKTTLVDGTIDWRNYVYANGQAIAVVSRRSDGVNAVRYLLDDHQGSTAVVMDASGNVLVKESFTPFGNGRDPATWTGATSSADQALIAGLTRRGYTFHTNLGSPQLGLIHMNGRVLDAITGRFLSPDPYVSEPGNTQEFNRYSYVRNNPMTFTDPSGFTCEKAVQNFYASSQSDGTGLSECLDEVVVTGYQLPPPTPICQYCQGGIDDSNNGNLGGAPGGGSGAGGTTDELPPVVITATRPPQGKQCLRAPANRSFGEKVADAIVGFGDAFLIPVIVRNLLDIDGGIDYDSAAYRGGNIAELLKDLFRSRSKARLRIQPLQRHEVRLQC